MHASCIQRTASDYQCFHKVKWQRTVAMSRTLLPPEDRGLRPGRFSSVYLKNTNDPFVGCIAPWLANGDMQAA